jgi:ribosome-binding protein aMBF1 (putative translation factor)
MRGKHRQGPQVALGRAIRLRREELGLSQEDLALDLGYDQDGSRISRTAAPPPSTAL